MYSVYLYFKTFFHKKTEKWPKEIMTFLAQVTLNTTI